MEHKVLAIVPIKEHSERVPGKNFRDFNGKPLYHWILETLENVSQVDKIVVNTDAEEVINSAPELFDIDISVRPDNLRGDFVSMNKIIEYEVENNNADIYLQTHCTNPLLTPETISDCIKEYFDSETNDSLFTVTRHQKMLYDENLNPINHNPEQLTRTQDLPPVFEDNSNLYIFTEKVIDNIGRRIGNNPMTYEMDEIESIDIDTPVDFEMAKYFHSIR